MDKELYDQYQVQDALQKNQLDTQTSMNSPQLHEYMQQNQAVLISSTNPNKIIREIILRLRGLEEKDDGTVIQVADPKVNKIGIDNIWFWLDSHINQNIILSHLDDLEIGRLMTQLSSDLINDLSLNWKEYGIKRKTDRDVIVNSILINIFTCLKRAEGQNEKNWLGRISVENISGGSRLQQPKKESFWSRFKIG